VVGDANDERLVGEMIESSDHVIYSLGSYVPAPTTTEVINEVDATLRPLLLCLDLCRKFGRGMSYLSSGGTVYGNPNTVPINEAHQTNPISSYGITKLMSEKYINLYSSMYGICTHIVRCANVYGEGQPIGRGQGAVGVFLSRLKQGLPITIYGDGQTVRDYVYIDDVASGVLDLLESHHESLLVNLGTGEGHSLLDLLTLLEQASGLKPELTFAENRNFDVRSNVLDIERIKSLITFEPLSLADGLHKTWERSRNIPCE
jgi:UDP-glucose 4-epimerase